MKNDFNHRVETLSSNNIKLQGAFRNCCQIIWGWVVNVTAQIREVPAIPTPAFPTTDAQKHLPAGFMPMVSLGKYWTDFRYFWCSIVVRVHLAAEISLWSEIGHLRRGQQTTECCAKWTRLEGQFIQLRMQYERGARTLDQYWDAVCYVTHSHWCCMSLLTTLYERVNVTVHTSATTTTTATMTTTTATATTYCCR